MITVRITATDGKIHHYTFPKTNGYLEAPADIKGTPADIDAYRRAIAKVNKVNAARRARKTSASA